MKVYILIPLILLSVGVTNGSTTKEPDIYVEEWVWDFGTIEQRQTIKHKFIVQNKGEADLIINDVRSTCACTAVLATPDRIKPGEKAEIEVAFYSDYRVGRVTKHVYVDSNDRDQPWIKLTVTGVVRPSWLSKSITRTKNYGCFVTLGSIACIISWFIIVTSLME